MERGRFSFSLFVITLGKVRYYWVAPIGLGASRVRHREKNYLPPLLFLVNFKNKGGGVVLVHTQYIFESFFNTTVFFQPNGINPNL